MSIGSNPKIIQLSLPRRQQTMRPSQGRETAILTYTSKANLLNFLNRDDIDLNTRVDGTTRMHALVSNPNLNLNVFRRALEQGGNLNTQSQNGKTPMHALAENLSLTLDILSTAIKHGGKLDVEDRQGKTPEEYLNENPKNILAKLEKKGNAVNVNALISAASLPPSQPLPAFSMPDLKTAAYNLILKGDTGILKSLLMKSNMIPTRDQQIALIKAAPTKEGKKAVADTFAEQASNMICQKPTDNVLSLLSHGGRLSGNTLVNFWNLLTFGRYKPLGDS